MHCTTARSCMFAGLLYACWTGPLLAGEPARPTLGDEARGVLKQAAAERVVLESRVRELIQLHEQLAADETLSGRERATLLRAVQYRLSRMRANIATGRWQADQATVATPSTVTIPAGQQVLAQQGNAPGLGMSQQPPSAAPPDYSRELMDLIQDTIAPNSWESRGGQGVIRFWPASHALVIRQSGGAQDDLNRLINDLR